MRLDMKLGAEPKKIAILALLVVIAAYVFWSNRPVDSAVPAAPVASRPVAAPKVRPAARPQPAAPASSEPKAFKPTMKFRERPDPLRVDPTLRTDLLDRVRAAQLRLAGRNLFEYSSAPPPPAPRLPKVRVPIAAEVASAGPPPVAAGPPAPPPPPPIPLRFFGFIAQERNGPRRAFFAEGEDVFVANEGELVRKRYKVVRINLNSCVMEDTQTNSRQTLPLEEARS